MSKRTLVLTLALTLSILLLTSLTYAPLNGTLQVSFIDVGQGDSMLMSTSGETHVLIDAGQAGAGRFGSSVRLPLDSSHLGGRCDDP